MTEKKDKKMTHKKGKRRVCKRDLWLYHFLDSSNSRTFFNRKEAAKAAGYKTTNEDSLRQIGCQNFTKLTDMIKNWLDEAGLSENALKIKLLNLMEAHEIKFFQHEGIVTDQREVAAIETQRRALDMAFKVRGMYAAEKRELTGKDGKPIKTEVTIKFVEPGEKI